MFSSSKEDPALSSAGEPLSLFVGLRMSGESSVILESSSGRVVFGLLVWVLDEKSSTVVEDRSSSLASYLASGT